MPGRQKTADGRQRGRKPALANGRKSRPKGHLCVVVGPLLTTILPWGGLPPGRLPRSSCRCSARHVAARNDRSIDSNIEMNDDASVFSNNVANKFATNAWYNATSNRSRSLRRSSISSCRHTCRRSARRSERYFDHYVLTNNERYFDGSNRAAGARLASSSPSPRARERGVQPETLGYDLAAGRALTCPSVRLSLPSHGEEIHGS